MHIDDVSSLQHFILFSIINMHFCTYIYVKIEGYFSHGFFKTVTSLKHYKNQWFLLIISSFLHPYLPPFVHSFTPSSLPLLLSVSLPTCLGPKNTKNGRCTYIAHFSRSHLPSTSELGFGHAQSGFGHAQWGFGHAQWGFGHAQLGFGHVKLGFTHAQLGFGHAQLGFGHAQLGFTIPCKFQ